MPDQKISQMDPAAALTGAELVPAVQSGGNVRTTTQDIANLVSLSSLGASANGITLIGHTFTQMRADLDLEAGTDFVAYSAYSANALTLIGHTFAQMRTDLSLVPGTDVQAYSAKLAALAAQTWAADAITYQTSTSAVSTTALTAFGRSLIDDADAATARTTLGLVIGTNVQAYNANLTTYAGIAPSANAQTLLGHTFSQMRTDLGLVIGTDVQAYDANTAKLNVAQTWTTDQTFTGLLYNRAALAAIGVLSSTGASGYGIRFSNTGASSDSVLLQGTTNSFTGAVSIANIIPSTGAITWSGAQTLSSTLALGGQLDITGGNLSSTNGFHAYFSSSVTYLRSLQNGVAWRELQLDASPLTINSASAGILNVAASVSAFDYGSAGSSLLYVGGANNQAANIAIRSNSGKSRGLGFYTGASSPRWYVECDSTAESGGNAGSNFAISAWTDAGAYSSKPFYIVRSSGEASLLSVAMGGPINMKSYTVAGLPAGSAGDVVYASNGRKNGEGAGLGTGVLVFKDGTAWRACDTGATVAA